MLIFGRCHCNTAAVTTAKYKHTIQKATSVSIILKKGKSWNREKWVPPPLLIMQMWLAGPANNRSQHGTLRYGQNGWHLADNILKLFFKGKFCVSNEISLKFINTLRPRRNGQCFFTEIYQHIEAKTKWTIFCRQHFQRHFLEWKCMSFNEKFHWSLFLRVQLTIFQHWFR